MQHKTLKEIKKKNTLKPMTKKDWWIYCTFFLQQEPSVNLVVPVEASPLGGENITNCAIRGGMREKLKRGYLVKRDSTHKDSERGQLIAPPMWFQHNLPRMNN